MGRKKTEDFLEVANRRVQVHKSPSRTIITQFEHATKHSYDTEVGEHHFILVAIVSTCHATTSEDVYRLVSTVQDDT